MKLISLTRKTNQKTEQVELAISILCLVNDIHLSKTQLLVLSYYVVYGIKAATDDLLLQSGVVKAPRTINNIRTKLCKLGFLTRTSDMYNSYELATQKGFEMEKVLNILIKLDRS